jgi:glycosyltransferase involved in cell wall biosynthesis
MRIAIVTTSWPAAPGDPSGHFVRAEALELERAGHAVLVVAPPAGGAGEAFGWPGVGARLRERPLRALGAARWILEARRRVRELAVDRLVAHWAVPAAWPIAAAGRDATLDVVSHGGDVRLLLALPEPVRDRIVHGIAERAATWRFVSDALRADLLDALGGATRRRVERIAHVRAASMAPLETSVVRRAAAELRRQLDEGGAGVTAVTVGRLVASKRVDRAIEYVARTRAARTVVVVGDGPERRRLEQLAASLDVPAHFVGLVPRETALAWIAAADVLLHASAAEGLSTVLREAEALGTRVLLVGG